MNILNLINNVEYFFEPISTIYKNKLFYFYRNVNGWCVLREDGKTLIKKFKNGVDVFNFMSINNIDIGLAERMFVSSICTSYLGHKANLKRIEKLIHKDVLNKAEQDFEAFKNSIKKTVNNELGDKKPTLTLVKE